MTPVLIAIDVGTLALGVAIFDDSLPLLGRPLVARVFTARRTDFWLDRLHWLSQQVEDLVDYGIDRNGWKPRRYAMEWPEFRPSAVGMAAAATDALGQLAAAAGYHACAAQERNCESVMVRVQSWKGSLPKKVVTARIAGAIGLKDQQGNEIASHAVDAVGIGCFARGFPMDHQEFCGKAKRKRVR